MASQLVRLTWCVVSRTMGVGRMWPRGRHRPAEGRHVLRIMAAMNAQTGLPADFRKALTGRRKAANLTLEQLGDMVGLSRARIGQIESGVVRRGSRAPTAAGASPEIIIRIANALSWEIEDALTTAGYSSDGEPPIPSARLVARDAAVARVLGLHPVRDADLVTVVRGLAGFTPAQLDVVTAVVNLRPEEDADVIAAIREVAGKFVQLSPQARRAVLSLIENLGGDGPGEVVYRERVVDAPHAPSTHRP